MAAVLKRRGPKVEVRRNLWTNPRGLAAVGLGGLNVQGSQAGATADQVVFADHDIPDLTLPGGSEIKTGFHVVTVGVNQGIRLPSASVVNGAAYTVSAYVYVVSGAVDAQIVLVGNGPDVVAGSGWQRVAHTSTITADTADFTVRSTSGAAEFYVTLALVEQAHSAGDPFDGSGYVDDNGNWREDTTGEEVEWTGTPHASASVRYDRPFVPVPPLKIKRNGTFTEAPAFLRQNDLWVPVGGA